MSSARRPTRPTPVTQHTRTYTHTLKAYAYTMEPTWPPRVCVLCTGREREKRGRWPKKRQKERGEGTRLTSGPPLVVWCVCAMASPPSMLHSEREKFLQPTLTPGLPSPPLARVLQIKRSALCNKSTPLFGLSLSQKDGLSSAETRDSAA